MILPAQTTATAPIQQYIFCAQRDLDCAVGRRSYARLAVVEANHPDIVCGQAHRIGYLSEQEGGDALYRLRVRAWYQTKDRPMILQPGLYVLKQRQFIPIQLHEQEQEQGAD